MEKGTVERVARISRLNLTADELKEFEKDLEEILDYFDLLDSAPVDEGFRFNPVEVADILRDDVPRQDIDPSELLKDMNTYEGYVRGPRLT